MSQTEATAYPQVMSQAAYARYLGEAWAKPMSRQAVHKSSVIPKLGDGRIDRILADSALMHHGYLPKPASADEADAARDDPPLAGVTKPVETAVGGGAASARGKGYYDQKAETERYITELKRIELEERQGKLLRIEDVEDAMVTAGRKIGDRIVLWMTLADEIAQAAGEGGAGAVRAILRREANAFRRDLAEALKLDADEAGDGEDDAT